MGFILDDSGGALIEYGLIGVLISIVAVLVMTEVGATLVGFMRRVADSFPAWVQ